MIQILYEKGHEERCRNLASVTANASVGDANGPALDKKIQKITTLCFWGHGTSGKFCGMAPINFIAKVKEWKKWNPSITTVEIITCNSRHGGVAVSTKKPPPESELPWVHSYTDRVKPELRKLGITLKALPIGMGSRGVENRWSILKWSKSTKTWLYVTAGGGNDTDGMWDGVFKVEQHDVFKRTKSFVNAGNAVKASDGLRKYTLDFGAVSQLRGSLVTLSR